MIRTKRIVVHVLPGEHRSLREDAAAARTSMSVIVRERCFETNERPGRKDAEPVEERAG